MKKMVMIMMVLLAAGAANADWTYTYGSGTNFYSKILFGTESVLVNGGGVLS